MNRRLSLLITVHPSRFIMAPECEPLCRFDDRSVQIQMRARRNSSAHVQTLLHHLSSSATEQEALNDPGFQTEQVNVRGIRTPPSESSEPIKHYYFTIDDQLMYMSFFQDWGPLNVAMVYKACIYIHSLLIVSHSLSYGSTICAPHTLRLPLRCCVTLRTITHRPLSR